MKEVSVHIKGMTCASCVTRVEKIAKKFEGIDNVSVNLATEKLNFTVDDQNFPLKSLSEKLSDYGYEMVEKNSGKTNNIEEEESDSYVTELRNELKLSIILTLPIFIISMLFHFNFFQQIWPFNHDTTNKLLLILTTPVMFLPGKRFFTITYKNLKHFSADMNTLVAVGSGAAFAFSTINTLFPRLFGNTDVSHQIYFETAAVIITLILFGKYLETNAKSKTSLAIKNLLNLTPQKCTVISEGTQKIILTKDLTVGTVVLIKPGESIPADGIILEGESSINESMITGESVPVNKKKDFIVTGGTINLTGSFTFKVTALGENSFLGKVVKLIENTQASKPPIQRLADKVAGVFVQIVIIIATVTGFIWYLAATNFDLNIALVNFVAVLIVACPCALGLATPTAILVGTGLGASNGILIKDAESLEIMYKANYVVFDKTGTVTEGNPIVKKFKTFNSAENEILQIAASVESKSEHPYAKAIYNYAIEKGLDILPIKNFEYLVGSGVKAIFESKQIIIGSSDLFSKNLQDNNIESDDNEGTQIFVMVEDIIEGYFVVDDKIKDDAEAGISKLHSIGLKTILLTGDQNKKAKSISDKIGTTKYIAEVKPDEKVKEIEKLQSEQHNIIMVGDGINDAPALIQADVGIAMGAGTDIAIESAKVILLNNKVEDVVKAFLLSRRTMRTLRQNLFWAFIYNIIGIPLAALGLLNPMIAALAMAFSSVSVVSNSLRLRRAKLHLK